MSLPRLFRLDGSRLEARRVISYDIARKTRKRQMLFEHFLTTVSNWEGRGGGEGRMSEFAASVRLRFPDRHLRYLVITSYLNKSLVKADISN